MNLKSISMICKNCEYVWPILVNREDELLIDKEDEICEQCGSQGEKTVAAPTVLRASFPDGTKRKNFADLREVSKLRKQMYNTPPDKRGEFKKAIKEISKKGKE